MAEIAEGGPHILPRGGVCLKRKGEGIRAKKGRGEGEVSFGLRDNRAPRRGKIVRGRKKESQGENLRNKACWTQGSKKSSGHRVWLPIYGVTRGRTGGRGLEDRGGGKNILTGSKVGSMEKYDD